MSLALVPYNNYAISVRNFFSFFLTQLFINWICFTIGFREEKLQQILTLRNRYTCHWIERDQDLRGPFESTEDDGQCPQ